MGLDRLVHFESFLNVGYCGYCGHPKNRYNQCSVNAQTHSCPYTGDGENIDNNFLSQFLQFSQELSTKENLLKAPNYLGT